MNAFQIKTTHMASSLWSLVTASAATTTATTVAAAATTAAAATAATTTAAAAAIFAWPGFVDGERPPIVLFAVHSGNGRLGFFIGAHFDKAETFASARVAIHDDLGTLHGAVLTKDLVQI
jgi:hypothetical protein